MDKYFSSGKNKGIMYVNTRIVMVTVHCANTYNKDSKKAK
jgi:hypothetical protein